MPENEILKDADNVITKWYDCENDHPKGYVLYVAHRLVDYCKELEKRVQELEKLNKNGNL